jgi:FkbM family methyltransferase
MQPITIDDRPMRLIWGSNSPFTPGGYGVTSGLVVPRLRDILGIEVAISATYGHYGRKLIWQGIDIYPPGDQPFGNDIHAANAKQHHADVLLTHQDVWTQKPDMLTANGTRWVSWQPLDSEPVAPTIVERLKEHCYQPIALSHFGQQQADLAGLPMPLVLQGIDTSVFVPGDRNAARERLGWPRDAFIVGMVARNSGYPNRKAYPQQLEAFAAFARQHADALLYIHAELNPDADREATPLAWQIERHGLQRRVMLANSYDLNMGYKTEDMVARYQAMDVLLCVSMSEGFGIPLIEAQSCGIPVITGDWTAMAENCSSGWRVAREDSEPWPVSPLECFWRLPHIGAIAEQLAVAYDMLQHDRYRAVLADKGRDVIVAHHDQDMLIDTQWRSVLTDLAKRIAAEPIPWHVHRWGGWGYETPAGVVQACRIDACPAEHMHDATAPDGFPLQIGDVTLDIQDDPQGGVRRAIAGEIERVYRLPDLRFKPGDVILDVGAHVGVVSCYLAKQWPNTMIYAFEPMQDNYQRLVRNVIQNGCANVNHINAALTCDGRDLILHGDHTQNTGGYSAWSTGPDRAAVSSMSLTTFLSLGELRQIALLKLDCEGAEYELLTTFPWERVTVERLIMEVHENAATRAAYGSGARLIAQMEERVPYVRASLITIPDPPNTKET